MMTAFKDTTTMSRPECLLSWTIVLFSAKLMLLLTDTVSAATSDAQLSSNSVAITFYELTDDQWTERKSIFQDAVAQGMTSFCEASYTACGLASWQDSYAFDGTDVIVQNATRDRPYFDVTFAVILGNGVVESGQNRSGTVLDKTTVIAAVTASRTDINEDMDSSIVLIEDERYSPAPRHRLNIIVIVCACVAVLILVIITVALYYNRKKKDQAERERKQQQQQQQQQADSSNSIPSHKVAPAPVDGDVEAGNGINNPGKSENSDFAMDRKPPKLTHKTSTFSFSAGQYAVLRDDTDTGNHTEDSSINMSSEPTAVPSDRDPRRTLPPLDGSTAERQRSNSNRRHRKHSHSKQRPHHIKRRSSERYEESDTGDNDDVRQRSRDDDDDHVATISGSMVKAALPTPTPPPPPHGSGHGSGSHPTNIDSSSNVYYSDSNNHQYTTNF